MTAPIGGELRLILTLSPPPLNVHHGAWQDGGTPSSHEQFFNRLWPSLLRSYWCLGGTRSRFACRGENAWAELSSYQAKQQTWIPNPEDPTAHPHRTLVLLFDGL
jgi:hypothetical protein